MRITTCGAVAAVLSCTVPARAQVALPEAEAPGFAKADRSWDEAHLDPGSRIRRP